MIGYSYELWKITSILCTFVANNDHDKSSFCILTRSKPYIQYCHLTSIEPGTTIHILYKLIIFPLLLIDVINMHGVYLNKFKQPRERFDGT